MIHFTLFRVRAPLLKTQEDSRRRETAERAVEAHILKFNTSARSAGWGMSPNMGQLSDMRILCNIGISQKDEDFSNKKNISSKILIVFNFNFIASICVQNPQELKLAWRGKIYSRTGTGLTRNY